MKNLKKLCIVSLCLLGFNQNYAQTDVIIYTSMGDIEIKLTDTLTPVTVDSFLTRVNRKFYDGLIFHRVMNNFMIQGGDPAGNGTGGTGTTIPDEFHPALKNLPGALAMANRNAPNTGDCQFYINLVTNNHLDNKHTVFGMVKQGFPVVQEIGKVPVNAVTNKPHTDVVIDSIRVKPFPSSVHSMTNTTDIQISPNPGTGTFRIDLPNVATQVEIVNMNGQTVFSATAKGHMHADLHHQPTGMYIVRFTNTSGTYEQKLIVQ